MVGWEALANNFTRVYVEGADGTGKTTLVKKLKEQYNIDAEDRSFITDIVYRLEDNNLPRENKTLKDIAKLLDNCIIIYCTHPYCFELSMSRGEENITTRERSSKIQYIYMYVMKFIQLYTRATVIQYCWEYDDINNLVKNIKEVL